MRLTLSRRFFPQKPQKNTQKKLTKNSEKLTQKKKMSSDQMFSSYMDKVKARLHPGNNHGSSGQFNDYVKIVQTFWTSKLPTLAADLLVMSGSEFGNKDVHSLYRLQIFGDSFTFAVNKTSGGSIKTVTILNGSLLAAPLETETVCTLEQFATETAHFDAPKDRLVLQEDISARYGRDGMYTSLSCLHSEQRAIYSQKCTSELYAYIEHHIIQDFKANANELAKRHLCHVEQ